MLRHRDAFTLLEMSIVLIIIAVILAGGAVTFSASLQQRQYDQTKEKFVILQKALRDYWRTFGRLPCPGHAYLYNPASGGSNQYFGREAQNKGTCDGTPAATFIYSITDNDASCESGDRCVHGGMVPTKTLGLPDDMAFDGWGRRFAYVVDSDFTKSDALSTVSLTDTSTTRITMRSVNDVVKSSIAAYTLISYGINGHGAYPRYTDSVGGYPRKLSGSVNTMEQMNCYCDSGGAAATFGRIFYQAPYATTTNVTTNTFDDMVVFDNPGDLRSAAQ